MDALGLNKRAVWVGEGDLKRFARQTQNAEVQDLQEKKIVYSKVFAEAADNKKSLGFVDPN